MKIKYLLLISVIIFCMILSPMTVYARSFDIIGTDMSIDIDDSSWYVFTRSNIKNNIELEDVGTTYDDIYNLFYDHDIYLRAIKFYDNNEYLELFISKKENEAIDNLANLSNSKTKKLLKEYADKVNALEYDIYETKFIFMQFEHTKSGLHIMEYSTTIDGIDYLLTFQANSPFSKSERTEMKRMVDSINFITFADITSNLKITPIPEQQTSNKTLLDTAISSSIIVLAVSLFSLGKEKKIEYIQKRKVYYGLLGCRLIALYVFGIFCAEPLLMLILGDSISGIWALMLSLIVAIPFTLLFAYIYKLFFIFIHFKGETSDKSKNSSQASKETYHINYCKQCGTKLINDYTFCHMCGTKIRNN